MDEQRTVACDGDRETADREHYRAAGPPAHGLTDPGSAQHAGHPDQFAAGHEPAHIVAASRAVGGNDRKEGGPASRPRAIGVEASTAAVATTDRGRAAAHSSGSRLSRAFDQHHAPDPALIADCVHCGFCLPTCPTYLLWGEEMDSPRGRIYLMNMASQGQIGMTTNFVRHMDLCLGCMACVTACPSGVQYEKLIEATRSQVERHYERSAADRLFRSLLFALFPYPERLRPLLPLLWLYQRTGARALLRSPVATRLIPRRLLGMEAVMPAVTLGSLRARTPTFSPARGQRRRRVGVMLGCVQRVFFSDVNAATIRVLTAEGCDVVSPVDQGCCGALSMHAGREADGLAYARRLIDRFEAAEVDAIVVNAAGCGSNVKQYGYLLRDDPNYDERARAFSARVLDITELLAELPPVAPRHPLPLRVAYHDACHLGHAQAVRWQPRAVLRGIPGLELLDIPESEICCGSAGIYNLVQPDAADKLGERKARNILEVDPGVIATANPGCLLQIGLALERLGRRIPTVHPVELVDASIRGAVPSAWMSASARPASEERSSVTASSVP